MYLSLVHPISPVRLSVGIVGRSALQLSFVEIDYIAAQVGIVFQDRLRQGMILVSHAEEAAEGHDRA